MALFKRRGRREDSSQESREQSPEPIKSRRPANTALRQQRLLAWSPVLTPRLIILIWSILAVFFLGLGGWLFYLGYSVRDLAIDYTDCLTKAPTDRFEAIDESYITAHFLTTDTSHPPNQAEWRLSTEKVPYGDDEFDEPFCTVQFNIPEAIGPGTVFYYVLENFYQNHRRYVSSFDAKQLQGEAINYDDVANGGCKPLSRNETSRKVFYPCGLIANSMFNDTFTSPVLLGAANNETYEMTNGSSIAWSSEAALYSETTKYKLEDILPPPNWQKRYPNGYTEKNPPPNLKTDYHFQNWMRTAAVPTFSKLYMRNDTQAMGAGRYQVKIGLNFDVTKWNGRKSFQISSLSLIGGRNLVLGIVFFAVGGVCLLMTIVFVAGIFLKPRKLGDHTYLSWNQAPAGQ